MTDEELAAIARGLSEVQKRFLRAASVRPKKWMAIRRHAKIPHQVRVHGMVKPLGLITPCSEIWCGHRLTPLGLALRAHLEKAHG